MSALAGLCREVLQCRRCALAGSRTRVVPGEGAEQARLLFVGEAPGWHEDQQGRPFVGQAGKFLDDLLASINLSRSDVYITNVLKCRPPGNRDPLPGEIESCKEWLNKQISLISPRLIVTLGRYSLAHFFSGQSISKVHGKAMRGDSFVCYAMYHPAAALHQQSLRRTVEEDMLRIPKILQENEQVARAEEGPKQLSMFG